jgi:hypothetical protein
MSSGRHLYYCEHCGHSLQRVPGISDVEIAERAAAQFPGETPTGQSRLAYRLAALILLTMALTTVLDDLFFGSLSIRTAWFAGLKLVLASGLLQFRKRTREIVLVIAPVMVILTSLIAQRYYGTDQAVCNTVLQISSWGALFLLLTGASKVPRLVAAVGGYVILSLVPFVGMSLLKAVGVVR